MSDLQKRIGRVQRREGPRIGFGAVTREQPRAMLLGVSVADAEAARAAVAAGADAVIVRGDVESAAAVLGALREEKLCAGAHVETLDDTGAERLRAAGCDFVVSTLEGTAATAVDADKMGQVLAMSPDADDNTLRAVGSLGLDALFVDRAGLPTTLRGQLELVRLASFSGTPLLVTVAASATPAELRVLRDSGGVMIVPPEGSTAEELQALVARLKAVPAPKRMRRDGQEMALVPSLPHAAHEDEEVEEPDEDD
ncbi:MAG: hypothetical protein IT429_10000 [Gemmataceae bacterium]|nr:hypothetical protein [Gemmataceae bacterium]